MRDAEAVFVGQLLQDNAIIHSTQVTPDQLQTVQARTVFETVSNLVAKDVVADIVSVKQENPEIDAAYLSEASNAAPTTANWRYYEGKIVEAHKKNRLSRLVRHVSESVDSGTDSDSALNELEEGLVSLSREQGDAGIVQIKDRIVPYLNKVQARYERGGALPGLETGFPRLSEALMGLQGERLYYVGARPSVGKSALLLNMASHLAVVQNVPTGILSLESGIDEIEDRLHSSESGVDSQTLAIGQLKPYQFQELQEAQERLFEAPLYLYDKPNMRLDQLISQARRMVRVHSVQALFVDYLQIINAPGQDKREQVEVASTTLKQLSRELKIPVVAAAQLRREADEWWPDLGSFQHSSQAEQDGDTCVFIGRKGDDENEEHQLAVAKNRDGPAGTAIPVVFDKPLIRFREWN